MTAMSKLEDALILSVIMDYGRAAAADVLLGFQVGLSLMADYPDEGDKALNAISFESTKLNADLQKAVDILAELVQDHE